MVGAGWAGLAAAVNLVQRGAQVTLLEMAPQPGGRARQVSTRTGNFDNGQHILIGAYRATLGLMRQVGADPDALLLRQPLALAYPDGQGLRLPAGPPLPAFVGAVLRNRDWLWLARAALLRAAAGWWLSGFRCAPGWTVQQLCQGLPAAVQQDLIAPLCVAALNTAAPQASAQVFLRVLQDALFSGRGSADLLLPRVPLSSLLPAPAWAWLQSAGALCQTGRRVLALDRTDAGWLVDGEPFDQVLLACSAIEAARLAAPHQPVWAARAAALRYQPIVTAYLADPGLRLPLPMLALRADHLSPAQFVFDLQALGTAPACFAFVVSGAERWLNDGLTACGQAVLAQARQAFPGAFAGHYTQVLRHIAIERRATFACTPGLDRPPQQIQPGLLAAGDYIEGPYPATLEGAVRSGQAAAAAIV